MREMEVGIWHTGIAKWKLGAGNWELEIGR
jgi:hypothetical protein